MSVILNISRHLSQRILTNSRNISIIAPLQLKEILRKEVNKTLTVEAIYTNSPREPFLIKEASGLIPNKCCPICDLELNVKHTDVLILSQYLRSDGCMLPRRVTGLCFKQQRRLGTMVTMAQKAGLMPNFAPANSKKDPKTRYQWKKYNKYFDEDTIRAY